MWPKKNENRHPPTPQKKKKFNEHDSCLLEEEYASCEFLLLEKQVLWAYAQVVVAHIRDKHGCNTTLLKV